jgi:hypothetical protein
MEWFFGRKPPPEPKNTWADHTQIPKDPVYDSRTVNFWKYRAFDKKN